VTTSTSFSFFPQKIICQYRSAMAVSPPLN
jgi:hypothetical protein